jgi:hypothetical protein
VKTNSFWERASALAAKAEGRQFTPEEQNEWDTLNEEAAALDKRIKSMLAWREKQSA